MVPRPDDAFAAELNALYLRHRFEDIELYEDVVPARPADRREGGRGA